MHNTFLAFADFLGNLSVPTTSGLSAELDFFLGFVPVFFSISFNIDNFEIDADKAGNWRYKLYNAQHAVIGVGESYSSKQGCENSVQSVIKFAESARLLEDQSE